MSDLKMLTQDDVAALFNSHRDTVAMWREIGIIRATKTGRCYMFSHEGIRYSLNDYKELDASKAKTLFTQGDTREI